MPWVDGKYNIHHLKLARGLVDVVIAWENGAFHVRINKVMELKKTFHDLSEAKAQAEKTAKSLLEQALVELEGN